MSREALQAVLSVLDEVERLDKHQKENSARMAREAKEQREWARRVQAGETNLPRPHVQSPTVVDYGDVWERIKALRPVVKKALKDGDR